MKISIPQLNALKHLIRVKERESIATQVKMSRRTVDAVLQGDRVNDEIEKELVKYAMRSISNLNNLIAEIESNNFIEIDISDYSKHKESSAWVNHPIYTRYMDAYIEMSNFTYTSICDVWHKILNNYKDIIPHGNYCIRLMQRLIGVNDKTAVDFYNKKAAACSIQ